MQFGPLPEKRVVPDFVRLQTQEELALKLLRQRQEAEQERRKAVRQAERRAERLVEQLALITHKKRFTEGDPLVLSLRQLLKREGVELLTYAGEEVTEELETEADIVEWLPAGEDPADRVVDALEPEVRWQGRVLHHAKLSCRMGAEQYEDEEPEAVSPAEIAVQPSEPDAEPSPGAQAAGEGAAKGAAPGGPKHEHGRKNTRKNQRKHQKKSAHKKRK